jgi:hypothetical protein
MVRDRGSKKRGACARRTVGGEIDSADDDTSQQYSWGDVIVLLDRYGVGRETLSYELWFRLNPISLQMLW